MPCDLRRPQLSQREFTGYPVESHRTKHQPPEIPEKGAQVRLRVRNAILLCVPLNVESQENEWN